MSTQTTNLGLVKPALTDNADISVLNQNADKIDAAVPFKFGIENGKYGYYKSSAFIPFGGGGGVPDWLLVQIFAHQLGITLTDVDIGGNLSFSAFEHSSGYEGFNIALQKLTPNVPLKIAFDLQFTNAQFFSGTQYGLGYRMTNSLDTNYGSNFDNDFPRDLLLHHHEKTFTPTGATAYFRAVFSGCSDSVNNYFTLSNLEVTQ